VNKYKDSRAVLIYATGVVHKKLAEEYTIAEVTETTPDKDLRSMDVVND